MKTIAKKRHKTIESDFFILALGTAIKLGELTLKWELVIPTRQTKVKTRGQFSKEFSDSPS
jgi:hypothetical protein